MVAEDKRDIINGDLDFLDSVLRSDGWTGYSNFSIEQNIIPAEPGLPLDSLNVTINNKANLTSTIPQPIKTSQGKIQPARGISVTESGEVILTAYRTNNAGERLSEVKRDCSRVKVSRYLLAQ